MVQLLDFKFNLKILPRNFKVLMDPFEEYSEALLCKIVTLLSNHYFSFFNHYNLRFTVYTVYI